MLATAFGFSDVAPDAPTRWWPPLLIVWGLIAVCLPLYFTLTERDIELQHYLAVGALKLAFLAAVLLPATLWFDGSAYLSWARVCTIVLAGGGALWLLGAVFRALRPGPAP